MADSAGARFRQALSKERPLQIVGAIHAYAGILAKRAGFQAIYLSGAGVANASFGVMDEGKTTLTDVAEDAHRIVTATDLPLLVDVDTGFGDPEQTAQAMIGIGVAGMHMEDQIPAKRCGHLAGKMLVRTDEMVERLQAAAKGRSDPNFVIIARTDAHAVEGMEAAIARSARYLEAGADMIFAEALTTLDEYRQFTAAIDAPVLANLTEFGRTPHFTREEMAGAGVQMLLYPLSAFRAMNRAADEVYRAIREDGTQKGVVEKMQTRQELYDTLE